MTKSQYRAADAFTPPSSLQYAALDKSYIPFLCYECGLAGHGRDIKASETQSASRMQNKSSISSFNRRALQCRVCTQLICCLLTWLPFEFSSLYFSNMHVRLQYVRNVHVALQTRQSMRFEMQSMQNYQHIHVDAAFLWALYAVALLALSCCVSTALLKRFSLELNLPRVCHIEMCLIQTARLGWEHGCKMLLLLHFLYITCHIIYTISSWHLQDLQNQHDMASKRACIKLTQSGQKLAVE